MKQCKIILTILAICLFVGCGAGRTVLYAIDGSTISEDEFELYRRMARNEMVDRDDTEEVDRQALLCAAENRALICLAEQYGVLSDYSFEEVAEGLQEHNQENLRKKQNNQPIYGPEQYELYDYFLYLMSGIEFETKDRIAETIAEDPGLEDELRSCYQKNRLSFADGGQIRYEVCYADGHSEQESIDFAVLVQNQELLGETGTFLLTAPEGSSFPAEDGSVVTLLENSGEYLPFEECRASVARLFVHESYFDGLLEKTMSEQEIREE